MPLSDPVLSKIVVSFLTLCIRDHHTPNHNSSQLFGGVDTSGTMAEKRKEKEDRVLVHVRVRPLTTQEEGHHIVVESRSKHQLAIRRSMEDRADNGLRTFSFDRVYWSLDGGNQFDGQDDVYNHIGKLMLEHAFAGFNTCIFAYGQTGSGKTYTMMGDPHSHDDEGPGIIPRACDELFTLIDAKYTNIQALAPPQEGEEGAGGAPSAAAPIFSHEVFCSYYEIYNERVYDLLEPGKENLRVREHPTHGPYVENLHVSPVCMYEEVRALLLTGNKYRHTNATKINERSSRSHAIFTITLKQSQYSDGELTEFISKINLVDLAGSERTKNAGTTGDVFNEGVNINKSLCNLGTVIHSLAESNEKHKSMYINFRDSNLTWLLRENLGGNSKTIMVATVSPSHNNYDESLNTLRYANRVKQIRQKAVVNEDSTTRLIRDLRQEVAHLRRENMEIMRLKHELATMKLANRKLVDDTKKAPVAAVTPQPAPVPAKAAATTTPHLLRARGVPYLVVLRPNPPAGAPVVAEIPRGGLYITDDADAAELSHDALHGLVSAHPCGGVLPRGRDAADGADVLRIAGAGRSSALVAKSQQSSKSVFEKTRPCELLTIDAECTVLDTCATVKKQASYSLFHGCFLQIGKAVLRFVDPAAADAAADRLLHLEPVASEGGATGLLAFSPSAGGRVHTLADQAQIVETLTEDQKALFHALSPEEQQAFLAAQPTPKEYATLPDENKRALEEARSEQLRLSAASPTAAAAAAAANGGQPKQTLLEQLAAYETLSAEDKKMFDELSPGAQRAFLTVQQASGSADATALLHLLHREERGGGGGKEGGVLRGAGSSGTTAAAADPAAKLTLEEERALYNKLSAEERAVFDGFSAARQQQFFQDVLAGERAAEVLAKLGGEKRDDDALTLKEKQRIIDSLNPEERALFDSLEAREQEVFLEHARELTGGLTEGHEGDAAAEDLQEREARVAAVRRRILEDLADGKATEASVAREVGDLRKALSLKPYEAQLSTSLKAEETAAASGLTVSEQLALVAGLTQEQQERFHSLDATRQQEVLQALTAGTPAGSPHGGADGAAERGAAATAADVDALLEAAEESQRAEGASPADGAGAKTLKERLEIFSSCLSEEMKQRFEELPAAAQLAFMQAHPLREDYDGLSAEEKRDIESQKEQTMQALQAASHLLGADGAAAAPSEAASVAALSGELHTLKTSEKRLQERVRESEMLIEKIHDERAAEKVMMNLKVEEAQCEIVAKEAVIDEVRKQLFAEREQYEKKLQEVDNRAKVVHEDQQRKDALNEECVRVLEFQFSEATNRHRSDRDEKEKIIADLESRLSATRAVLESERHEAAGTKIHSSLLEEKLANVESSLKSTIAAHTALADELSSSKSHITSLEEVCDESKRKVADLNKENASRSDEAEVRTREIFDLREKERELSIAVEQQKTISKDELLRKQKELDHMKELTEQGEIAKAAVESQCAMLRDRVSTSLEDIQRLREEIVGVEKDIKEKETTLDVIQVEKAQLSEQHTKEVEDHRRERAKQISEHQQTIRALNEQLVSIQQQARDVQEKNRDLYQAQEKIRSRRTALKSELDRKEDELRDTKKKYVEAHSRLQTSIKRGNSDRKHLDSLRRLTSVVKEQEVRISYLQRELRENQAWTRRLEEGNASSYTSAQVHEVRQDVQTVLTQLKAEVVQFTPVTLRQLQTMANFITASHDPRRIFRQVSLSSGGFLLFVCTYFCR